MDDKPHHTKATNSEATLVTENTTSEAGLLAISNDCKEKLHKHLRQPTASVLDYLSRFRFWKQNIPRPRHDCVTQETFWEVTPTVHAANSANQHAIAILELASVNVMCAGGGVLNTVAREKVTFLPPWQGYSLSKSSEVQVAARAARTAALCAHRVLQISDDLIVEAWMAELLNTFGRKAWETTTEERIQDVFGYLATAQEAVLELAHQVYQGQPLGSILECLQCLEQQLRTAHDKSKVLPSAIKRASRWVRSPDPKLNSEYFISDVVAEAQRANTCMWYALRVNLEADRLIRSHTSFEKTDTMVFRVGEINLAYKAMVEAEKACEKARLRALALVRLADTQFAGVYIGL